MEMIKLKNVTINKYKSIGTEQSFKVEPDVTVLVGKNESGKTAILEAISKSNPYQNDQFEILQDYPRKEVKKFERRQDDARVIQCTYVLQDKLIKHIKEDIGPQTFATTEITCSLSYRAVHGNYEVFDISVSDFFDYKFGQHSFEDEAFKTQIRNAVSQQDFDKLRGEYQSENQQEFLDRIENYFANGQNPETSLREYVVSKWIEPHLPKFLYYDEYYLLPSDIDIRQMQNNNADRKELKTSKALFELADINIEELLKGDNYEAYKAELEATGNEITETLFEYWKTNTNLHVQFDIERPPSNVNNPILKIRVYNTKYRITLSLGSRSRGFNWFFSFLVWFSKIQEDKKNQYILLLDEPGLNLHASAQSDLLRFIEDLAKDYQVIYTTHSPFMIDSDKLHQVRTVLETEDGTRISESLDEDDKDTLFPLQAALGYNIAQNLFIGQNNLVVEGISDIIYLRVMSSILKDAGRTGLQSDIVVVPVGGFGKVATFVSLLHGNELNMACLLDRVAGSGGEQEVNKLIKKKLIKAGNVMYFNSFAANGGKNADVEDMFAKSEYLSLFNETFDDHEDITVDQLDVHEKRIVKQIQKHIKDDFNHYRPAYTLSTKGVDATFFSEDTLNRFEKMFEEINKLFKK